LENTIGVRPTQLTFAATKKYVELTVVKLNTILIIIRGGSHAF